MRIVQIVPSLEERHGGPSKSVRGLSAGLARLQHEVTLLATTAGTGSRHQEAGLEVEIFHRNWPDRLCLSRGLRAGLKRLEPEVIHHHSVWLRTLHYAHRRAKRLGVPLVISPRGMLAKWTWAHHNWRKRLARWLIHPGAFDATEGGMLDQVLDDAAGQHFGFAADRGFFMRRWRLVRAPAGASCSRGRSR